MHVRNTSVITVAQKEIQALKFLKKITIHARLAVYLALNHKDKILFVPTMARRLTYKRRVRGDSSIALVKKLQDLLPHAAGSELPRITKGILRDRKRQSFAIHTNALQCCSQLSNQT